MGVTGTNVKKNLDVEKEEARLTNLLDEINQSNQVYTDKQNEIFQAMSDEAAKQKKSELLAWEQEQRRIRFEKEQEEKARREKQEQEEQEALERNRAKNPLYPLAKKLRGKTSEEEYEDDEDKVSIAANIVERTGDAYRVLRENVIMSKRRATNKVVHALAKNVGINMPELPEDLQAEEERIKEKKEQKRIEREEMQAQKAEQIAAKKAEKEKLKTEKAEKRRLKEESKKNGAKQEKASAKTLSDGADTSKETEPICETDQEVLEEQNDVLEERNSLSDEQTKMQTMEQESDVLQGEKPEEKQMTDEEWDKGLSDNIRDLKKNIRRSHHIPEYTVTDRAINEIQTLPAIAIVMTSKDMNDLFIFTNKDAFINLVADTLNYNVDYSYIYVVTPTAAQYFGADTCYHDLTELFDHIRKIVISRRRLNEKNILSIPNINMFRNIHLM